MGGGRRIDGEVAVHVFEEAPDDALPLPLGEVGPRASEEGRDAGGGVVQGRESSSLLRAFLGRAQAGREGGSHLNWYSFFAYLSVPRAKCLPLSEIIAKPSSRS